MSAFEVMRRASLGVFAAIALACASASGGAFALMRAMNGINVDVASLRANAGDPTAAWVARALPGALAQALAEVGRARAPISVRIHYVILGPSSSGTLPGGAAPDQMVGEVVVGGIAHELRAQTSYYPMAVDQPNFEQSNYDRIVQLCQAFAYWAARGM
jgi:predicted NBD/HSP70 family sugar kinase